MESESAKDTSKVINKANGSKGLGLFQVSTHFRIQSPLKLENKICEFVNVFIFPKECAQKVAFSPDKQQRLVQLWEGRRGMQNEMRG